VNLLDDRTQTSKDGGGTTVRRPQLKLWEQEIIQSNGEVKRKATIAQLCEAEALNYPG
jgi:hypothetical protein